MYLSRRAALAAAASIVVLATAACGSESSAQTTESVTGAEPLTVYSGRSEELVGPLLEKLETATGTAVEIRYGDSSELAAQLLEEGENTGADLYFSQDAGALGALAKEGRLAELPASIIELVPADYVDDDRRWVATSARARVIAYHPTQAPEVAQMTSIDQILDPRYKGKVGIAPTNASFQAFVTALRLDKGEQGAKDWLTRLKANEPVIHEKNGAILDAVDSGQVALGLINHYYWYEKAAEAGAEEMTAKIHFLGSDDPGALINVAGVGVLADSPQADAATTAIEFLLSAEGQQYFADTTAEYPVVEGITTTKHDIVPLSSLEGSSADLGDLDSLPQTLAMLDEVGLT